MSSPKQHVEILSPIITTKYLLPLLISQPGGLLVEVTDGTTKYNASHYRISVYYDLAKVAVNAESVGISLRNTATLGVRRICA